MMGRRLQYLSMKPCLPQGVWGLLSPESMVSLLFFIDFVGKKQQRNRYEAKPQAHFVACSRTSITVFERYCRRLWKSIWHLL